MCNIRNDSQHQLLAGYKIFFFAHHQHELNYTSLQTNIESHSKLKYNRLTGVLLGFGVDFFLFFEGSWNVTTSTWFTCSKARKWDESD